MSRPRFGVLMDSIEQIKPWKDTSFALLLAAQERGWRCEYIRPEDIYFSAGQVRAQIRSVQVTDQHEDFYSCGTAEDIALTELDILIQRQDPPIDLNYHYITALLALAEQSGLLVANKPDALRASNEKLLAQQYPQFCPPTLVSRHLADFERFLCEQNTLVVKPLDAMGGAGIFKLSAEDPNSRGILELLTESEQQLIMAQRFLPEIAQGDKRVLLVDGKPVSHGLLRTPGAGSIRANLAAGGSGNVTQLTEREYQIANSVGPELAERGFWFVGLDIIGGWLTEINVTSPTCAREIHAACGIDAAGLLLDALWNKCRN